MSTPADADVPLVHTSFTCVEETAGALAKERARQIWRSPVEWVYIVIFSLIEGFLFSGWGQYLPYFAIAFVICFVLASALIFGLKQQRIYRRGKRLLTATCPPGTVLRAEFGTHGFTLRSPRSTAYTQYGELKRFSVHPHSAIFTLNYQPALPVMSPRELFPDAALKLIEPHAKVRRRG